MGTEINEEQITMVHSQEEPNIKSSSENAITRNEKLMDDNNIPVVGHLEDHSNGQLDTRLDSGSMYDATKDGQGYAATNINLARLKVGTGDPISPSNLTSEYDLNRILIDTTAPFESVKEAVSKFGGIVDWKAHKVQTVERRKIIEQELKKVQQDIPLYREQSMVAEQSKIQILKDLENTKRLIEDLKLNLERAQTEERQAQQDSELAQLRAQEMEQGIAHEASVAAKTQMEVAKARHETAISDLKKVRDELKILQKEYETLLTEKDVAEKKAEEAVSLTKEIEKNVEELTIELISTKESLESSHAAHLEAEEHRIGAAMAKEQDRLTWEEDLKHTEEDLAKLYKQIELSKDLKSKLNTASTLLADLKAELASYMQSKISQEMNGSGASKELEEVKLNIEKVTEEVNCLKVAATSLKAELETEKSELASLRQREGMASLAVASLEAELDRIKSEIAKVQMREKEVSEKMAELPKQLQEASREADEAKSLVELAREELRRAKEEAEQAKAEANTMETRLLAAKNEIEASRASEKLALDAIKAVQESGPTKTVNDEDSPDDGATLSLENYYELSKRVHDAEEEANMKVSAVMSQIEVAKEYEIRSLTQLEEANQEVENRKEALRIAMEKAEKAKEGKLGVEQELRKWRAESEQRRKTGESSIEEEQDVKAAERLSESSVYGQEIKIERVVDSNNPSVHYGQQGLGLKNLEQIANPSGSRQQGTTPESYSDESVTSPKGLFGQSNTMKKKRRSLFPRFFMFLARRKPSSKTS